MLNARRLIVALPAMVWFAGCTPATPLAESAPAAAEPTRVSVTSPDGRTVVTVTDRDGRLNYRIDRDNKEVIAPSRMGMRFLDQPGVDDDLQIVAQSRTSADRSWTQPWGERRIVADRFNEVFIETRKRASQQGINLRFRVFDDGVGFRYEVPEQDGFDDVAIIDELTEFNVDENATAWWIPARKWNRYEYLYEQTAVRDIDVVHTPVTFRLADGTHVSLHEAALVDYSGMSIEQSRPGKLKANLAPRSDMMLVRTAAPFKTPWRTVQIASDAAGLINSDLILNLNEPNRLGDVDWFKPGKYVGIWWAMHIRDRTWGRDGIHGATTQETMRFMDFAAEHGFDGVLVEGWNIGWDGDWFHNGDVFSFTESYPDFDIEAVARHAKKTGVRLIGHHETSGNISNYETQLDDALDLYERSGVRIIKTGYVADAGDIKRIDDNGIVRYEYHDSQHMVDHHLRVVEKAAEHRIAINPHEPVKDTGLRRTYPNWVSREGARGQEFNAWGVPPNPPEHTAILPFTRMLSGPMDFTPGIFDLRPSERPPIREDMPRNDARSRIETTLAKQLSLYVVLYSPIQMAADLLQNYEANLAAFQFIKDVPADWEDSRALQGEVGDYVVIVRKDRNTEDWYLGALTDEDARNLSVDLDFLSPGADYEAQMYLDGLDADFDTNPYPIRIESKMVQAGDSLQLPLAAGGGAAIRFARK